MNCGGSPNRYVPRSTQFSANSQYVPLSPQARASADGRRFCQTTAAATRIEKLSPSTTSNSRTNRVCPNHKWVVVPLVRGGWGDLTEPNLGREPRRSSRGRFLVLLRLQADASGYTEAARGRRTEGKPPKTPTGLLRKSDPITNALRELAPIGCGVSGRWLRTSGRGLSARRALPPRLSCVPSLGHATPKYDWGSMSFQHSSENRRWSMTLVRNPRN